MFCESCGSFIPDGQSFCSNCGAAAPQPVQPAPQPVQPAAQPVQPLQGVPVTPQPAYQEPVYQQPAYAQPVAVTATAATAATAKRKNGMATAGMIFGILAVCFCWIPVFNIFITPTLGLLGLIFSIVGLVKKNVKGKGMAIAGIILSVLSTIFVVLYYVYIYSVIASSPEYDELTEYWDEIWEELDDSSYYSTSYSGEAGADTDTLFTDGDLDFATTDKGYVSGVLYIDGFRVDY
jgi:hypothetical protein